VLQKFISSVSVCVLHVACASCCCCLPAKKLLQLQLRFLCSGSSFGLSCHAPFIGNRPPPSAPLYVFLGSSIWSKAEQLSVKMRNTYAQSAHKTTTTKSALSHCHAPLWQPPISPSYAPASKKGAWPCHLLNEMSSKLAVNLFAIFLLLFGVRSAICCFARFQ